MKKMTLIALGIVTLALSSCCGCWTQPLPGLRPMPEWTEDNPPDMPIKVYTDNKSK